MNLELLNAFQNWSISLTDENYKKNKGLNLPKIKIGYPCMNRTNKWTTSYTFRLKSYSHDKMIEKIQQNLNDLNSMIEWNNQYGIKFFRIGSGVIPFASHSICDFDWKSHFANQIKSIGDKIKQHDMRISMHPDHYVKLQALDENIVKNSIRELEYHADFMDLLGLDYTHKFQIHTGGAYGDKNASMNRFIQNYNTLLSDKIKRRLVLENDDVIYTLSDVLYINRHTGIPVLFDNLHYECKKVEGAFKSMKDAMLRAFSTWDLEKDGIPMVDYSAQQPNAKLGKHRDSIVDLEFIKFLINAEGLPEFDVMLEIKDKEKSCLRAIRIYNDSLNSI